MRIPRKLSLLVMPVLAFGSNVSAEEVGSREPFAVDEIVVTAFKREQGLQTVPVAVSAVTGQQLQERRVDDLIDLRLIAPSLNVSSTSSASSTIISIRGIGTAGLNPGFESAVGTFVDGVYRSRAGHAVADLFDLQRVEILRGPQSTVFGKNTSAGVLQIITNAPEDVFGAGIKGGIGNKDLLHAEGYVTGPVNDKLAYRLSGTIRKRDGVLNDVALGEDDVYGDRDRWALRGQLAYHPTDSLNFRLIVDYRKFDEISNVAPYQFVGPVGGLLSGVLGAYQPPAGADIETRDVAVNTTPFDKVDDWGASLETVWEHDAFSLTSITAYRSNSADRSIDTDHSNADILAPLNQQEDYETFSQEVRFAGTVGSIDWMVGGYFFDEQLDGYSEILYASQTEQYVSFITGGGFPGDDYSNFAPGTGVRELRNQDSNGWAVFTQNTWSVGDFSLTGGLRYSRETKKATLIVNDAPVGTFINDTPCNTVFAQLFLGVVCNNYSWAQERTDEQVTGTLKASYQVNSDVMVYASYGRGFKSGGFNLERQAIELVSDGVNPFPTVIRDGAQFAPEKPDAYELGVKSRFFDNTLTVNAALFYTDYKDFQFLIFDGTSFTVDNLPKIVSRGAELEAFYRVAPGIGLNFGLTLLDVYHGKNLTPSATVFPGEQLQDTPKYQLTGALNVDRNLNNDWRWLLNLNVYHQGSAEVRTSGLANVPLSLSSYTVLNGSIGIATADDRLSISLWARNLTNEFFYTSVFPSVFQNGSNQSYVSEPRTFGLEFGYNF